MTDWAKMRLQFNAHNPLTEFQAFDRLLLPRTVSDYGP